MTKRKTGKNGRPPHAPTAKDRKVVEAMAGYGIPQEDIARAIGIGLSGETLRKHYAQELAVGSIRANALVAQSLFKAATKGSNVTAMIWWMKNRMGWTDVVAQKHEVTGKNGGPIQVTVSQADARL